MAKTPKADEKPKCFIIMAITTPEHMLAVYRDGEHHFKHVLDHLLSPSVEQAGYVPIPSTTEGAEVIHVDIFQNLGETDLVLCDMSALNPNAFFELGIRTALNRPVCLVKDEHTKAPFDPAPIKYEEYRSTLDPWEIEDDIPKIAKYITASAERCAGQNPLWRRLGLAPGAPYEAEPGVARDLEYLRLQMDSVLQKVDSVEMAVEAASADADIRSFHADAASIVLPGKRGTWKVGGRRPTTQETRSGLMEKLTQQFMARDEESGESVELFVYTDILDAGGMDDPGATIPGLKHIRTADGLKVNRLGQGKYQVVVTQQVLVSDDPDAP